MPSSKPTQSGFRHGRGARDLRLHAHLKEIPAYREAFAARVAARLKPSSADPAPPLTQSAILARFDSQAGQVRSVLECEAMRWIADGTGTETITPPGGAASSTMNKGLHRLMMWGETTTTARDAAANARADLKAEAREGRYLNDIPPPTITFSGGKAIITRPGVQGTIYAKLGNFSNTNDLEPFPTIIPSALASDELVIFSGEFITARIYAFDLDGEPAWSAPTIAQAP
jgi:hypothetical protein